MFEMIKSDFERKFKAFGLRPEDQGPLRYVKLSMELGTQAVVVFRFCRWARSVKTPIIGLLLRILARILHLGVMVVSGINIQPYSAIGRGFAIHNFSCIFILAERMGDNCTVNQGVTIGNVRGSPRPPILGDNVYVGAGAKILGEVNIGSNVVIAANSLVVSNVPDNCTVAGVPARVISKGADSPYLKYTV
jgi:serine O-acetyltransferase